MKTKQKKVNLAKVIMKAISDSDLLIPCRPKDLKSIKTLYEHVCSGDPDIDSLCKWAVIEIVEGGESIDVDGGIDLNQAMHCIERGIEELEAIFNAMGELIAKGVEKVPME
jgi:hypothetical protein